MLQTRTIPTLHGVTRPPVVPGDTLPSSAALRAELPASPPVQAHVRRSRQAFRDALRGRDPRPVMIVGPCSLHDPRAALEYARALRKTSEAVGDRLLIVMRTYFEKPRTRVGWKGMLKDPHLDGSGDLATGLRVVRRLLLAINEIGLPCAAEVLDPLASAYLADLLSWAVIGARTVESQTHRELASSLPLPVGFKNGTTGSVQHALDAMATARVPQAFLGVGADGAPRLVRSRGNPDLCLVLRGGDAGGNFAEDPVATAVRGLRDADLPGRLVIDCSHGNSGKDHRRQGGVAREVIRQICGGQDAVMGLMIESHLRAGRQALAPGRSLEYGVSVTDACVGWEETEALLFEAAERVSKPPPAVRGT